MGGVAIHAVGATGADDADLGHGLAGLDQRAVLPDVLQRMAHLHRAGMGTQQVGRLGAAAFDIEGVMHGPCRVVLWRIQCGEVKPVGLDFRALGNVKTHGAKNRLDASANA